MNRAVPMLMLQLYVNPCLHSLVNPAIVTVVVLRRASASHIAKGNNMSDKICQCYTACQLIICKQVQLEY